MERQGFGHVPQCHAAFSPMHKRMDESYEFSKELQCWASPMLHAVPCTDPGALKQHMVPEAGEQRRGPLLNAHAAGVVDIVSASGKALVVPGRHGGPHGEPP